MVGVLYKRYQAPPPPPFYSQQVKKQWSNFLIRGGKLWKRTDTLKPNPHEAAIRGEDDPDTLANGGRRDHRLILDLSTAT